MMKGLVLPYGQFSMVVLTAALLVACARLTRDDPVAAWVVCFGLCCGAGITTVRWEQSPETEASLVALFALSTIAGGILSLPLYLLFL